MSSIRNAGLIGIVAGALLLTGCQQMESAGKQFYIDKRTISPEPLSQAPVPVDPAMTERQWGPSATCYANDDVVAGPIYSPLQVRALPYWLNAPSEQLMFLGNLWYILPGVVLEVPWKDGVYKSLTTGPSYTLMPPLPSGPAPAPTY